MANQFLALSLFVMLLSFFIILNAMSNFEEHMSHRVLNSINVAFSQSEVPEDVTASLEEDSQQHNNEGDTLEQIQGLFKAQITGVKMRKNRMGTMMHLRIPVAEFERQILHGGGEAGTAQDVDLRQMLVSLLTTEDSIPYRMNILVNLSKSPASLRNENPQATLEGMKKSSLYAEILEQAGLPKKFMTAGVSEGPLETVDLFFERYAPYSPVREEAQ